MRIKLKDIDEFNSLIISKGFSKRAFAKEADLGASTVVQITKGDRNASPATANKIASALGVGFSDIFVIQKDICC